MKLDKMDERFFQKLYFDEFEVIDGLKQHKGGLTFKEWMLKNYDIKL
jgi:hypothetical protein